MRLRAYLKDRGCTHRQAAKALGVATVTLSRWMSGQREPTHEHMRAVFDWSFGIVTPNDFVLDAKRTVTLQGVCQRNTSG